MRNSSPSTNAEASSAVARYSLIAMFLTTVHHVYGAYAYDTPWRLHVTFIAGGAAILILGAYSVMRSHPADRVGTVARWLFVLSVLVIPVVLFGAFEGFYNHLVKNVLYFGGLPASKMAQLFPPPEYELPNDVFFEITGVLQVVPTVLVIKHIYQMLAGGGRKGTADRQRVRSEMPERDRRSESILHARRWWALAVIGLAQFMVILDVTVVNVALPSIESDLGLGRVALTWVVTAYSLAFGGFMLLGGRLADVMGRRRTFISGVALFSIASLASGLAPGGVALIGARAVQGLGAALASPAALAILVTTFDGAERDRALGVWAALGAAGAAVGGVLGGALTSGPGWRWIFLINLPAGIAVASSIGAVTGADALRKSAERLDVRGAVLATTGVGLLIFGLVAAGGVGWGSTIPVTTFIVAAAVLALFVRAERGHPSPLLRLDLLGRRSVAAGTLLMLAASGLLIGTFFLTSLLMQRALGVTAFDAGLAFLPAALATALGAHLGAHVIGRAGPRPAGAAAFVLAAVGLAWLARVPSDASVLVDVLPGFVLAAAGIGMAFVVATSTALGDVAEAEAGIAGSVVNTMHELGGALGVALASAVAANALGARVAITGFGRAYLASAVVAAIVAIAAGGLLPRGRPAPSARRHFAH